MLVNRWEQGELLIFQECPEIVAGRGPWSGLSMDLLCVSRRAVTHVWTQISAAFQF